MMTKEQPQEAPKNEGFPDWVEARLRARLEERTDWVLADLLEATMPEGKAKTWRKRLKAAETAPVVVLGMLGVLRRLGWYARWDAPDQTITRLADSMTALRAAPSAGLDQKVMRIGAEQFKIAAATTALTPASLKLASEVMVKGRTGAEVAEEAGVTRQRVYLAVERIRKALSELGIQADTGAISKTARDGMRAFHRQLLEEVRDGSISVESASRHLNAIGEAAYRGDRAAVDASWEAALKRRGAPKTTSAAAAAGRRPTRA